jgi:hypothetical protein
MHCLRSLRSGCWRRAMDNLRSVVHLHLPKVFSFRIMTKLFDNGDAAIVFSLQVWRGGVSLTMMLQAK